MSTDLWMEKSDGLRARNGGKCRRLCANSDAAERTPRKLRRSMAVRRWVLALRSDLYAHAHASKRASLKRR
jgi:hypothetical protein